MQVYFDPHSVLSLITFIECFAQLFNLMLEISLVFLM